MGCGASKQRPAENIELPLRDNREHHLANGAVMTATPVGRGAHDRSAISTASDPMVPQTVSSSGLIGLTPQARHGGSHAAARPPSASSVQMAVSNASTPRAHPPSGHSTPSVASMSQQRNNNPEKGEAMKASQTTQPRSQNAAGATPQADNSAAARLQPSTAGTNARAACRGGRSRPGLRPSPRAIDRNRLPSPSPNVNIFCALWAYDARTPEDLTIAKGDKLEIIDRTDADWWRARNVATQAEGYVPSNYIAPIDSLESQEYVAMAARGLASRRKGLGRCRGAANGRR